MTTYRTPDPAWCGLVERGKPSDWLWTDSDPSDLRIWLSRPDCWTANGDGFVFDEFDSRDDALVAWCLATGRRQLVVVPTWEELGVEVRESGDCGWVAGSIDEGGPGWQYEGRYRELAIGTRGSFIVRIPDVADEVDARWTVAVLQAIEAGLTDDRREP